MVSKKFALVFCVILLIVAVGGSFLFFNFFRVRAEAVVAHQIELQVERVERVERIQAEATDQLDLIYYSTAMRAQFAAASAELAGAAELYLVGMYIPIFDHLYDYEASDIIHLHIVEILERHGTWKLVRTHLGEKWINTDWKPDEILLTVPGFNQQALGLPTGCEIVALAMIINKYVEVDVLTLVHEKPRNYDPLLGFRGDPFSPGGFTILPPALLEITERYIGSAIDMTGASIEELQMQLARGRPVVVWLRGMFGFYVHAITLTGFNQEGIFYNDPWLGGVNEFMTYARFLAMWEDPIIDRRLHRVYPIRMALSY